MLESIVKLYLLVEFMFTTTRLSSISKILQGNIFAETQTLSYVQSRYWKKNFTLKCDENSRPQLYRKIQIILNQKYAKYFGLISTMYYKIYGYVLIYYPKIVRIVTDVRIETFQILSRSLPSIHFGFHVSSHYIILLCSSFRFGVSFLKCPTLI